MAAPKITALRFPAGGINRRLGFQSQAPYTCVDALNVRPDSVVGHRDRGGSRPGTAPSHRGELGSGSPVRMLASLDVIELTGLTYWQDTFEGSALGSMWSLPSWLDTLPSVERSLTLCRKTDGSAGATRAAFSTLIDTAKEYVVELHVAPYATGVAGVYRLFARMDNTTPDVDSSGVELRLTINADDTHQLELLSNGVLLQTELDVDASAGALSGWLSLRFSGDNCWVYWHNETAMENIAVGSHSGQRVGFGITADYEDQTPAIDAFRVQYYLTGGNQRTNRRIAMASAGGSLYREDWLGSMKQVTSSLTLASDRSIQAQQRLQKLYIADTGDWKASGSAGARGTGNTKFDAAAVSDWTTVGIDTDDDVLIIFDSTEPTKLLDGVYKISSVSSGELTLTTDCATEAAGTCSWYITRAPKVYDAKTDTLSQWTATTAKGFVPPTQPLVCLYRDRLVLAGGSDSPHLWYMSRQGDPLDWFYGATDPARAVAGQSSQAGAIGEPITALCPHGDICLVFGCKSSLWILRGDPAYGGQIDNLSHNIGIVDKFAWTYVPNVSAENSGTLIFLSLDGVYMLGAGCGASEPISISREKMPEELLHVDCNLVEAQLVYDLLDRGVHIFLTKKDSGETSHWWLDWETKGFFRMQLPAAQQPTASLFYQPYCAEDSCAIMGGRDGVLRRFHKHRYADDGNTRITSYVDYGPVLLGDQAGYEDGILAEIQPITGGHGKVLLECRAGNSAEAAFAAKVQCSDLADAASLSWASQPRVRGNAAFVRLSGVESAHWTVESIMCRIAPGGRLRRQ